MVFDGSGEVRTGIEEACNSGIVFCEELDECWQNEDSWCGLMNESFNVLVTGITGDDNPLLFDLVSLLLKHRLSRGVFCEDLDDFWPTEDSWGGLMTGLFNGEDIVSTGDDNSLLFEWISLRLNHRLLQVVVRCLPWLSHVPLLWRPPITFGLGIMNAIWVCGGVVWLLFFVVDVQQKVGAKFLARQLQSYLSFSTRNKIDYKLFVSI